MSNDPAGNDPKKIWQNQPRELSKMTLEKLIHRKGRDLHAKTRGELLKLIALLLFTAGFSIFGIVRTDNLLQRIAFVLAIVWALVAQYGMNRGMWSAAVPGESGLTTGLQFYRSSIEQRRSLLARFWAWTFGPLILAIAAFFMPLVSVGIRQGQLPKMLPFLTLLVIWFGSVLVIRRRTRRELQREIDELNEIEKENP